MAHRFTRAPLAGMLAALVAATPLAAQWQGVVSFHSTDSQRAQDFDYYQGPGGMAKIVTHGGDAEGSSMIFNKSQGTATVVMPSQQMYMTMPLHADSAVAKRMSDLKITATGKTDVVAGHKCSYYHVVDPEDKSEGDACVATDMGNFALFDAPMHRGAGNAGFWQQLFSAKGGGFFPLKMTSVKNGKQEDGMVATQIQEKSIPASEFAPPSSYKAMSMPNMRGPTH